jgi:hypothetical protein
MFAVKNQNGKCIAACHHNDDDTDCIGRAGKTMDGDKEIPCPGTRKLEV